MKYGTITISESPREGYYYLTNDLGERVEISHNRFHQALHRLMDNEMEVRPPNGY